MKIHVRIKCKRIETRLEDFTNKFPHAKKRIDSDTGAKLPIACCRDLGYCDTLECKDGIGCDACWHRKLNRK